MFPDPSLTWRPYPSAMDGIKAPPFVLDRGMWKGILHLIVLEANPGTRAYGIEIRCDIYSAFEEMIYSIVGHGDKNGMYDGTCYIKEAEASSLMKKLKDTHPNFQKARQFLFVGGDYCYETIGSLEPIVHIFANKEEAYAWAPWKKNG